ncbi:MAG TPA: ParB N-terminal domain-containing protein [Candidatus Krumholzibacteria bacterium]|nr:ParB N-terminal domain-containing protein [Candidatus Krumholzibacteria bacterium]
MQGTFQLVEPGALRPHEDVDRERVRALSEEIRSAGSFYPPVLIDQSTRVILDGHHRWHASALLGFALLPCYAVDYLHDDAIRVISRRTEIAVTKHDVLAMALSGRVYPCKTTRHVYDLPEAIEPVPLDRLLHATL